MLFSVFNFSFPWNIGGVWKNVWFDGIIDDIISQTRHERYQRPEIVAPFLRSFLLAGSR